MEYTTTLRLQKCLYLNVYLFVVWAFVISIMLNTRLESLGHLTKYLCLTVLTLIILIEAARLYLGYYGNISSRVPELAGFLMLTVLMQMPLVSFFLFNPYLLSTPTEITLHSALWLLTLAEVGFGFQSLRKASLEAKNIYLSHNEIKKQ